MEIVHKTTAELKLEFPTYDEAIAVIRLLEYEYRKNQKRPRGRPKKDSQTVQKTKQLNRHWLTRALLGESKKGKGRPAQITPEKARKVIQAWDSLRGDLARQKNKKSITDKALIDHFYQNQWKDLPLSKRQKNHRLYSRKIKHYRDLTDIRTRRIDKRKNTLKNI